MFVRSTSIRSLFISLILLFIVYFLLIRLFGPKPTPIIIQSSPVNIRSSVNIPSPTSIKEIVTVDGPPKTLLNSPLHDELTFIKYRFTR